MDTKLKRCSKSTAVKVLAFIVLMICIASMTVCSMIALFTKANLEQIICDNYYESTTYHNKIFNAYRVLFDKINEKTLKNAEMSKESFGFYFYYNNTKMIKTNLPTLQKSIIKSTFGDIPYDEIGERKDWIAAVESDITLTNHFVRDIFINNTYESYCFEDGVLNVPPTTKGVLTDNTRTDILHYNSDLLTKGKTVYIGFDLQDTSIANIRWNIDKVVVRTLAMIFSMSAVFALVSFMYLLIISGRKNDVEGVALNWYDKTYTEVQLGIIVATILAIIATTILVLDMHNEYIDLNYQSNFLIFTAAAIFTLCFAILTSQLLSIMRKIKAKTIITQSIIYKMGAFIWHKTSFIFATILQNTKKIFGMPFRVIRAIFNGSRYSEYEVALLLAKKQKAFIISFIIGIIFLISAAIIVQSTAFTIIVIMLFFIVQSYIAYKHLKSNDIIYTDITKILQQIKEIKSGNLQYKPQLSSASLLIVASNELSDIGQGLQASVAEQIRAERTKLELITNVSHDLKTPLTSIISYIDLLQKQSLVGEANDYVNILSVKSERLKNMVDDLFSLAKATADTGNVVLEEIDFKRLIEQTLADMDDKIVQSGLLFKVTLPSDGVIINADGKKLYRVLQNVIDNALLYSLSGTRIFLTLENSTLTIINTAKYEINFTADEVLERFTRGDKARNSDGSGLGLSIAQGFTKNCGGEFNVNIDGDQFKVIIQF